MRQELRFIWRSTRGFRLRPWDSPYIRWRMETFSGLKADELTLASIINIIWVEKTQFWRFLRWTGEIRSVRDQGLIRTR